MVLEKKVNSLQEEIKYARNHVVDSLESERNHIEDKVMALQMTTKVKDEQILSLKHEVKILENRLKSKLTEMSHQKSTISATNEHGKKQQESHQSELELQTLAKNRLQRLLADKDEELASNKTKAEVKLEKTKSRLDQSVRKLNDVIKEQLCEIQALRSSNQTMDAKLGELEKEILLREAAGQSAFSTMNTSKGAGGAGGSLDIGNMSIRDLRREDQATIDDLGD